MTLSTHACPYYLLQLTFTHLLLVNMPLVPLSLASAQVMKRRKETLQLNCSFRAIILKWFLKIYSRPTNDHQKRLKYLPSKKFSSRCQSLQ